MRTEVSIRVDDKLTAGQLIEKLKRFPADAKISVYTYQGDRPWDSGYSELEIEWSEDD